MSYDVCRAFHGGDPCSEAANESVHPDKASIRADILQWIADRQHEGATCDEVEVALGLRHQTASARMRELVMLGMATKTGRRRPTRSGRNAAVLVVEDVDGVAL
jgi:hypothetical protein